MTIKEASPVQVDVLRRYMSLRCAHLVVPERMEEGDISALCGIEPTTFWMGGNGPQEMAMAQKLRICKNCVRILGAWCVAW